MKVFVVVKICCIQVSTQSFIVSLATDHSTVLTLLTTRFQNILSVINSPPLSPNPAKFRCKEAITLLTGALGLTSFLIWVGRRLNIGTFLMVFAVGMLVLPSSFATLRTFCNSGSSDTSQSLKAKKV